jgi:Lon protease-like protein
MSDLLPLFPLNLVVFPNENLNLHIFEPRYRQLINESIESDLAFGIPVFFNNKIKGYGTEMRVKNIEKQYADGRMDVKTRGFRVFRIIDFKNPMKDKLYAGGEVAWIDDLEVDNFDINPELLRLVQKLYDIMKVSVNLEANEYQPFSYRIAHKIGLNISDEYELLTIAKEETRQERLIEHLYRIIPTLEEVERTKERIKMNGHFKNLDPLNL